jgi:hypothetical protein
MTAIMAEETAKDKPKHLGWRDQLHQHLWNADAKTADENVTHGQNLKIMLPIRPSNLRYWELRQPVLATNLYAWFTTEAGTRGEDGSNKNKESRANKRQGPLPWLSLRN